MYKGRHSKLYFSHPHWHNCTDCTLIHLCILACLRNKNKPHLFNHETHFNLNRCSFKLYAFSSCGVLSWEKTLSSTVWMKSSCDEHSSDYTSNSHTDFIEKQGAKGYWPVDYATVNNAINKWLDYIYLQCIIIFQPHLCINDFLKHNFHFSCSKQEVKHGFPDWFRNLKQK